MHVCMHAETGRVPEVPECDAAMVTAITDMSCDLCSLRVVL